MGGPTRKTAGCGGRGQRSVTQQGSLGSGSEAPPPHKATPAPCPLAICPNQPPAPGGGQDAALAQHPLHVPKALLSSKQLGNGHWPEMPGADARAHTGPFPRAHAGGTAGHPRNATSSPPAAGVPGALAACWAQVAQGLPDQGRPSPPARVGAHSLFLNVQRGERSAPSRQRRRSNCPQGTRNPRLEPAARLLSRGPGL